MYKNSQSCWGSKCWFLLTEDWKTSLFVNLIYWRKGGLNIQSSSELGLAERERDDRRHSWWSRFSSVQSSPASQDAAGLLWPDQARSHSQPARAGRMLGAAFLLQLREILPTFSHHLTTTITTITTTTTTTTTQTSSPPTQTPVLTSTRNSRPFCDFFSG